MFIRAGIVGRPNVGKSTFFNCLLGRTRAIVGDFAGVTRDYKEELLDLKNFQIQLVDTAGLKSSLNTEQEKTINRYTLNLINHLDIIHKDMLSILKKNNIHPIDSIGKKLDPNLHQAMMEIEDETKESGIIVQEIQKGFMMKDRLLRPSLVGVAKKIDKKEQNSVENKEKSDEKK